MARQSGLGPLGHRAVQRAVEEHGKRNTSTSPITEGHDPIEQGNPAVTSTSTDELDTVPDNWWTPAKESTRIATAGYDVDSQRLYVLFHKPFPGGTPWTYEGVPPNVWRNLKRSESPGKFVNRVLNNYNYHAGRWGQ